ncbi:DUF2147 domain-containing protein [Pararcticibacter amylolyticus]|uniref:DUF2147 domain-containing protein n=1 Tax=Pararcticibacter amylolyticus TaxID=2173175 RepID=A0A2U2PJC6_9SPHI|nr:DUF2147 domain-containing protein [Pararcticibacter amylolyticus]PWG81507.1 hypothetical protein DDR33_06660 [Pararcticibacter amylolyticus]
MQKMIILTVSLFIGFCVFAQTDNDKILGKWTNEDKSRVIEFVKNGDAYDAIIRQANDESLAGKKQITSLQKDGINTFKNGTVHVLKKSKTARCTAKLVNDDKLEITATFGMMSRKQTWSRVK